MKKNMITTNFIYNFGQIVLDKSKKTAARNKKKSLEVESDEIIEEYEGECEDCREDKPAKSCPICGE